MKRIVCVVFDRVAKCPVSPLLVFGNRDEAARAYGAAVREPEKGYPCVNPQHVLDHELLALGEFDDADEGRLIGFERSDLILAARNVEQVGATVNRVARSLQFPGTETVSIPDMRKALAEEVNGAER